MWRRFCCSGVSEAGAGGIWGAGTRGEAGLVLSVPTLETRMELGAELEPLVECSICSSSSARRGMPDLQWSRGPMPETTVSLAFVALSYQDYGMKFRLTNKLFGGRVAEQ